jgi:hypothetical protein
MTTIQVSCLDNPTKMNAHFSHLIKKKKKTLRLSAKFHVEGLRVCVAQINVEADE